MRAWIVKSVRAVCTDELVSPVGSSLASFQQVDRGYLLSFSTFWLVEVLVYHSDVAIVSIVPFLDQVFLIQYRNGDFDAESGGELMPCLRHTFAGSKEHPSWGTRSEIS